MIRLLLVLPPVLMVALVLTTPGASAQQQAHQDACARDVSRFCRAHIDDDDLVILACLKENRAKLSKACEKVLADNGQ
jgi:hypothetical protein